MAKAVMLKTDFTYYAPRCLRIKDKSGMLVPFVFNRAQQYLHSKIEEQRERTGKVRIICVKGRQQGISTYIEGRFYWRTSMRRGTRAYILTHLQEATDNLFNMTRRYHENCPDALRPSTRQDSTKALTFDKLDSEYSVATAGSKGTGRSGTGQLFHGSEAAFWPNAADHMAGIGQTIPNEDDTEIILESTGNGVGNLFHGMTMDAIRGESEYQLVFIPWMWQTEYRVTPPEGWVPADFNGSEYGELYGASREQLYWRELKIKTDFRGDENLFDQEYPATVELAFRRQSIEGLLPLPLIERAMRNTNIEAVGPKIMGIDPAEYGSDDTIFILRQGRVAPLVKRFHGRGPMEVVALAAQAIAEWQPDYINVDAGGIGSGIADRLIELGYPVTRILFGERAIEDELYGIRKDEMAGDLKKWLEDQPNQIVYDDALKADLSSPSYTYDSSRRLKVESKEHMKARGLKSPDGFDALCLTFATKVSTIRKKISRGAEMPNWRTM
jgi:hypothetical protein